MPVDVALSQWIGLEICGCNSSPNVSFIILAYFAFKNISPSSTSAADAAKKLSIWKSVNIASLRWMWCLSCGFHTRKTFPAARLRESLSDKYNASEWKFRIMSDA